VDRSRRDAALGRVGTREDGGGRRARERAHARERAREGDRRPERSDRERRRK